ncbi:MAG: T9SS type A sorting domain-containing protein [Sporocytophaga sp.]|uniref:T9SS type A sorting domain-containing protein n=1 Tax=Sporocytophaga sp. TaxID=2231183 RepID=UPI001B00E6F4|nr:T9SS type A sorting domain-containing protein [Sporocytophaga sp.]MBO9702440.1 T9SS type A sorting domain-containing protein [Sporocytophaga sp.]
MQKFYDFKYLSIIISTVLFFLILPDSKAQSPANDDCSGAINLTVDAPFVSGNVQGATQSMSGCVATAGQAGGSANDDVWYKFQATSPYLVIAAQGSEQFNAVVQVFSGGCSNLTPMDCASEGKIGKVEKLPLNYYTPGNTYYVRVYDLGVGMPATTDFQIKVYTAIPPANDNCATAKPVTVSDHCMNSTENQEGATGSGITPTCANGAANNDDIWYSFQPTSQNVILSAHASHNYRAVMEVYDGCGGNAIGCTTTVKHNQALKLAFHNLNPAHTYYFRVFNYYQPLSKSETFQLCVYDPPAPSNDDCSGAIEIVGNDTLSGSVDGATATTGYQAPCSGSPDDDLWYKFTAGSNQEAFSLFPTPYFDGVLQAFDACNGQQIGCVNAGGRNKVETLSLNNLTAGQDYFIRVFTTEDVASVTADFKIARTSGPTAISNDDCAYAINIPVSEPVNSMTGSLENATQSKGPCNGTGEANDVWYKFIAASNTGTVKLTPIDGADLVLNIVSDCAGNTIACVDDNGEGDEEIWQADNLVIHQPYFIRIYDSNGGNHNSNFIVSFESDLVVQAINDKDNAGGLIVFPIPVENVLNIQDNKIQKGNLTLCDLQGNILLSENGDLKSTYDISAIKPGAYILKIISDDRVDAIKIIKR